ncbi:hypothetical protein EV175_002831 [Coemansia sp. RSA 1933]|nr:hypothetical protein EV175_002831 [Coemansia sp. RSA 1933]
MDDQRPRIGAGSTWINMRRGPQTRRAFQGDDESSASSDPRRTSQASYAELMRVYGRLSSRGSPHALAAFGNQNIESTLEQNDNRELSGEGVVDPGRYNRDRSYDGQGSGANSNADGDNGEGSGGDSDGDSDNASGDEHGDPQRYRRHSGSSDDDDDEDDDDEDDNDDEDDDADMAGSHDENTTDDDGDDGDGSNNDYGESEVYDAYHDNYENAFSSGIIGASYEDLPSLIASASRQAETRQVNKQPCHKDSRSRLSFMPRYLENTAYGALYRKNACNGHPKGQNGRTDGMSGRGASVSGNGTSNGNGAHMPLVSGISPDIFFKTLVQDTWPHYCTPGPAMPTSFAGLQLGGYGLGIPPDQLAHAHLTAESQISQPVQRGLPEGSASGNTTRSRFMSGKPEGVQLPSEWAPLRNSHNISIGSDRVTLRYTGPGRQDNDAAMVLADVGIPTRTGVYYFEVQIKSRGQSGYIGIGLSRAGMDSNRLPGWDIGSWGYHGDDGHIFGGDGRGTDYGPRFTTGDTVGCGIDFVRQRLFFTRNGFFLGYAFASVDISRDFYPCIGMRTPGEHVTANFGRKPFAFDIDNYVNTAHDDALKTVGTTPLSPLLVGSPSENGKESGSERMQIADLLKARNERQSAVSEEKSQVGWSDAALGMVISYLVHSEHYSTACALIKNAIGLCSTDSELAGRSGSERLVAVLERIGKLDKQRNSRMRICKHVGDGEIDYALGLLQESYPRVLEDESLVFQLRCRQFIELVRLASGYRIADCVPNDDSQLATPASSVHTEEEEETGNNGGEHTSGSMMDVDDTNSSTVLSLAAVTNAPESSHHQRKQFGQIKNLRKMEPAQLVRVMLEYGRQLQADYGSSPNPIIREGLVHTFSLLAYADPAQSPIAALLDPSACKPLARLVEMAISASEGAPRMTSLENISRQTGALLNELSIQRNGAASLISLERDFLKVPPAERGGNTTTTSKIG